jgi:RNA polymerase sigma-70 factor (ECF subfamily)
MGEPDAEIRPSGEDLLVLYDHALPQVYGYLAPRCGSVAVAEDLTSETFLAAANSIQRGAVERLSVAWLIGIARHKLVDHWRRQGREDARLALIAADDDPPDQWDATLDAVRAREVLARLAPQHQAVLTLRYLDDLSVREVAGLMNRGEHATEALLMRAKAAFRLAYEDGGDHG